jgi:dTMP kinase
MKNIVIAIEGVDSVGKETQAKLLQSWAQGFCSAHIMSFPNYTTPTGKIVRSYLNGTFGPAADVNPVLASSYYALNRAASKPAIDKILSGNRQMLIMDRYVHSNVAFQGGKLDSKAALLEFCTQMESVEFDDVGLPRPDVVIFLDAHPAKAIELMERRITAEGRIQVKDQHESNLPLLTNAYNSYRVLAKNLDNWVVIPCIKNNQMRSIEAIQMDVRAAIKSRILD